MDESMDRSIDESKAQTSTAREQCADMLHEAQEGSKKAQKASRQRGGDSWLITRLLDWGAVEINAAMKETDPHNLKMRAEIVESYHLSMTRLHERFASLFELVQYAQRFDLNR
jgi:hypothetical protein